MNLRAVFLQQMVPSLKGAYVHDISSDNGYQFDAGSGNGRQLTQRPDDVNANNYISGWFVVEY